MATEGAEVPVIKNLYPEPWKQQYSDLRLSTKQSETCGLAASVDLIAAPWDVGGGGVLGILKLADVTRNPPVAKIKGHTSTIQDTNFNPFHSHVLATACEDTLVRVWEISGEIDGSTEIKEPIATLSGASKKVLSAEWNPMAAGVLASAAFDGSVFLWDVTRTHLVNTVKFGDAVLSLKWSWAGQQAACTTKDKFLHVCDLRTTSAPLSTLCHEGSKAAKCTWLDGLAGKAGHLITAGFGKSQARELAVWDIRNFTAALSRIELDRGSASLYPTYDETTGIVYVCGKGDTVCRYYQFHDGALKAIDAYRSTSPIKNFCFIPKLAVNQMRAEIGRMLKQENNNVLLPVSFIVPRKNQDVFQPDLYPPAPDCVPTLTADEWLNGQKKAIRRVTVTPGTEPAKQDRRFTIDTANISRDTATAASSSRQADSIQAAKARASSGDTSDAALKQRIEELEGALADEKSTTEELQGRLRDLETRFIAAKKAEKTAVERAEAAEKRASAAAAAGQGAKHTSAAASSGGATSAAALEKKVKDLETQLSSKAAQIKRLEAQVKEMEECNTALKNQMQQAEGTLHRAATLAGLDKDMKQELNEMRDFFRDILEHVGEETP